MAASAFVSIGQTVDCLGDDLLTSYIQSGLIRLGRVIGNFDGKIGPKTREGLKALGIDPTLSAQVAAEFIDKALQERFPTEDFGAGTQKFVLQDAPTHLPDLSSVTQPSGYTPHRACVGQLGNVVKLLQSAKRIDKTFVSPPRYLGLLPGGQLYFDSNLELDPDGWPGGGRAGDHYWQHIRA